MFVPVVFFAVIAIDDWTLVKRHWDELLISLSLTGILIFAILRVVPLLIVKCFEIQRNLSEHEGFRRAAYLIPFLVFVAFWIHFFSFEYDSRTDFEDFALGLFKSSVFSLIAFIVVKGIHWVVDGFNKNK